MKGGRQIKFKLFLVILVVFVVLSGCSYSSIDSEKDLDNPVVTTLQVETVRDTLDIALEKQGAPYVWGANGPDKFDCSGFIIYTYREAVGKDVIFKIGDMSSSDVSMDDLYNWNVKLITLDKIIPGDILFFTRKEGEITHGGLFIEWIDYKREFLYINASSSHGEVVIDSWQIKDKKGDYWFVGTGRLKKNF